MESHYEREVEKDRQRLTARTQALRAAVAEAPMLWKAGDYTAKELEARILQRAGEFETWLRRSEHPR